MGPWWNKQFREHFFADAAGLLCLLLLVLTESLCCSPQTWLPPASLLAKSLLPSNTTDALTPLLPDTAGITCPFFCGSFVLSRSGPSSSCPTPRLLAFQGHYPVSLSGFLSSLRPGLPALLDTPDHSCTPPILCPCPPARTVPACPLPDTDVVAKPPCHQPSCTELCALPSAPGGSEAPPPPPHRHRPKEMASLPAPRLFPLLWVALRWGPPARTCPLMSASGLQSQGTHVNRHGGRPPSARPDSAWVSSAALRGPHCWLCLLLAPSREQVVTELAQNSCLESVRATQHVSPSDRSGQSRQEGEKAPEPGPRATHEGRVSGRGDRAPTQLPGHRASGKRPGAQQAPRAVR